MTPRRVVVIGAGPIGLGAALGAARRGLDVQVLEKSEVGASLLRWGPTRFFSPLAMNLPPGAGEPLAGELPPPDALLTGPEFARDVLRTLAERPPLAGRVHEGHRVLGVGRAGMSRGEYAGHPLRAERPLRLLVERGGQERWVEADAVLDASGTHGQPTALGAGGLAAPGEARLHARLIRDLGTLHARRAALAGRCVLLVGHGHSAANALGLLSALAREAPATRVVWATRSPNLRPCVEVASDPLPERRSVVSRANEAAMKPPPWLRVERRASVLALDEQAGALVVSLTGGRRERVDEIVALTGYRPDLSFLGELALEISPVTEGAARLSRALSNVTDCLSVPALGPQDLSSGEPGFHLVGAKSYGRARTFLLQAGYAQLETMLDAIARPSPA